MNKKCSICNSIMLVKAEQVIGGDPYIILYCNKCKHQCARAEN